ncbi:MAG: PorP/SprF family type IX secretion system membrane protein [Bacteroidota bacterium]
MKTLLHPRVVLLSIFLMVICSLGAQDIHFSQYYNVPMNLNPALTGVFDGDMRFVGNFREQWRNVPITYRTAYGSFETKFKSRNAKKGLPENGYFSGGLLMNFDHAGDSRMGTIQIGLNGSYTHKLTETNYLTAGVQVSGNQRSFDTEKLTFGEQYNGKQFDSSLGPEPFNDKTAFYADFSVGANWNYRKKGKRTALNVGGALYHINQPNKSFWDEEDVVLPARWSFYGIGIMELTSKFDVVLSAMGWYQDAYTQNLLTAAGRFHLDTRPTHQRAIQLAFSYRFNDGFGVSDALIPAAQFHVNSWIFGLSYDINISDFEVATANLGGPELSVVYILKRVPTPEYCPTCPTYL